MGYTRVSFQESFQDWAEANSLHCNCKLASLSFAGHHAHCPLAEAAEYWKNEGRKLYEALPKRAPTTPEAG